MIYLNERIANTVSFGSSLASGMYRYQVMYEDNGMQEPESKFVGNFYHTGGSSHEFDITDIIRSDVEVFARRNDTQGDVNLVQYYWIRVYTNESTYIDSTHLYVAKIYPYPNSNYAMNPNLTFFDLTQATIYNQALCLQGYNNANKTLELIPRYPLYENSQDMGYSQYPLAITMEFGGGLQTGKFVAVFDGDDLDYNQIGHYDFSIGYIYQTYYYCKPIGEFINSYSTPTSDLGVYFYNNETDTYVRIATFEPCYSRYYLQWQDRFGSFQSQPFNDSLVYSEDFQVEETLNYKEERVKSNVTVQPKYKITSGWIKEELYPYYESIYTSPVLRLLDTKTDKVTDVILKGNYTEKNYKNQKKMLNLTLDLEATNKQHILY